MLDELWLLLLAGHDSTASTLAWFAKFMGLNLVAQAELRKAVQEAFSLSSNKFPTSGEILEADIPMLDATIEETLRCAATASITTRRALVDTEVLGYRIPKGSNVLLNLRIDRKPFDVDEKRRSVTSQAAQAKRWRGGFDGPSGQDLELFEPRRWLALDPATKKEVFDAYALPSLTFGGGFRGCFGKRLAMLELRIIISTLMLNFEFLPLPEQMSSMEAEEEVFRKPKTAFVKLRAL
jgi:cytochrome P450